MQKPVVHHSGLAKAVLCQATVMHHSLCLSLLGEKVTGFWNSILASTRGRTARLTNLSRPALPKTVKDSSFCHQPVNSRTGDWGRDLLRTSQGIAQGPPA